MDVKLQVDTLMDVKLIGLWMYVLEDVMRRDRLMDVMQVDRRMDV